MTYTNTQSGTQCEMLKICANYLLPDYTIALPKRFSALANRTTENHLFSATDGKYLKI